MKELILSEEELIRRCLKKERHAQEFLFNKYYDELYVISMRYLADHQTAEDATTQAFVKVFKSLKKFTYQGQGSLGRWVRTILINESLRLLKKRDTLQFEENLLRVESQNSGANALQEMQAADILSMIEKLPAGYRTVFNLYAIEGYSHKEIAKMLGISESTSKTQLKKARHRLMFNLNEERNYGTV